MTYNRATLRLYKEPKLYNGSRYTKYFSSESERDAYFANPDLDLGEIQYNSTDGTINVKRNLGVLLEYSYGILTVMDTDMYIFIDDIQVGYNDVSTIYYSIDYYETARFKFNVTKGHLSRLSGRKPQYMLQPFSPFSTDIKVLEQLSTKGCFLFTYIPQEEGQTSALRYGIVDITPETIALFQAGTWQEGWNIADGDIKDCFIVPFLSTDDISNIEKQWEYVGPPINIPYYRSVKESNIESIKIGPVVLPETYTTDEQNVLFIADWFGNKIYEVPPGVSFKYISIRIDIGTTHCQIHGRLYNDSNPDDVYPYLCENNSGGFCYECRHVSLFVDSYTEYVMRQRDYDVESRQIQNEVEFYKGMVSTIEAGGYGSAFGGPAGAVTSILGGLVETFGTAIINDKYAPKLQALEDKKYSLMQDEMSIIGDSLTNLSYAIGEETAYAQFKPSTMYLCSFIMDDASKQRMDNDIAINGYHCDETVDDIDSLISTGTIIQADNVVIEGTISSQYRNDIASRFERGIEFI